ncbi:hypothetical protein RUM44_001693 [Polyplax serrata]|uniref:Uncharacterized protein n=1 Tax=Polyplax serrata TaxID=468196 RepID=A0ABR1AKU5_POLSC
MATSVPTSNVLASAGRDEPSANQRAENALDALLDELQTFARPPGLNQSPTNRPSSASESGRRKGSVDSNNSPLLAALPPATSSLRRLHSYPSSSDDSSTPVQKPATGPKPPVPERNSDLLLHLANRRVPPPPPPRTSSRSPLASPTSPSLPPRATPPCQPQMGINTGTLRRNAPGSSSLRDPAKMGEIVKSNDENLTGAQGSLEGTSGTSSSCESVSSQEGVKLKESRKEQLEQVSRLGCVYEVTKKVLLCGRGFIFRYFQRHQELLRKQKALQEQYARLQQLQRGATALSLPTHDLMLKKTGSESNLLSKMGLGQSLSAAASISGSLTHLVPQNQVSLTLLTTPINVTTSTTTSTTKIYETDIL